MWFNQTTPVNVQSNKGKPLIEFPQTPLQMKKISSKHHTMEFNKGNASTKKFQKFLKIKIKQKYEIKQSGIKPKF